MNCGLLTNKNEPVPLKNIEVDLQVLGHVATVTSTLKYINEEDNTLEAVFVFPMPSGAALCHFSAKIADQEIVAEVQEKQEAREQYDDALSSGEQAFLLEESEESADVFRLSVGSLPPHQSAAVTFIYIIELSVQADHSLQFCLPAVLNPRYTPAGTGGGIVSEITSSSTGIPYSLSFTAHINSPNPITKVESKCPLEPLMFLNTDHTKAKVCFSFGIGEGASSALITGLAENSCGHAQFITGTDRMQAKVMQSLRYALQPAVTDITEDWFGLSFSHLSPQIKSLFHGQRALIYAQLKGEECQNPDAKGKISVHYRLGVQEVTNSVDFFLKPVENTGMAIHRLGARSLIRSLERDERVDGADKDALKARVVELSKQCGVSSSHTAFIAVHKGKKQAVKGPLVKRRILLLYFVTAI
ncbi:von Willebrand factor A domain-containing protein 5A-like [Tachysurus fulvidraco]|uniref:von Willebrand factor A domain-containing protein 5A-like n=1 Tax=Tachysurus fulvidraco TaxID=1234273 RepID=UPI000F4F4650|nr:von Willebrand factor A domain-containing protein 5A-like [Tachysurus fulvidraco]